MKTSRRVIANRRPSAIHLAARIMGEAAADNNRHPVRFRRSLLRLSGGGALCQPKSLAGAFRGPFLHREDMQD
jgi:hypothetical protein